MAATNYTMSDLNTTIFGRQITDIYQTLFISSTRTKFRFKGTQLQAWFQFQYTSGSPYISVSIDGGAATNVTNPSNDRNTAATLATGLTDDWHTAVINWQPVAGSNPLLNKDKHVTVTGAAPDFGYMTGYGRAYHTGNHATAADVWRFGAFWTQNQNGASLSQTGGTNGGSAILIKTDATKLICYWDSIAVSDAQVSLLDTGGNIISSGVGAVSTNPVEVELSTGQSDGVFREFFLGVGVSCPISVVAVGGTLKVGAEKPAARDMWAVTGTSITVSNQETNPGPNHQPETAGSLLGPRLGGMPANFGVGGSTLIKPVSEPVPISGESRLAHVVALNPKYIIIEHACNDRAYPYTSAQYQSKLEWYIAQAFAQCANLSRVFVCPFWTDYQADATWRAAAQAAVAAANAALGSTKAYFIDTSPWSNSTPKVDGVHPSRSGAVYVVDHLVPQIEATFVSVDSLTVPTLQVVPGMRLPFSVTVLGAGGVPIEDYGGLIASVSQAGVTLEAQPSGITNASGVASWTDEQGLYVDSSVAVGTTFDITIVAGSVTATIPVSVVSVLSGSGTGDGDTMTIESATRGVPATVGAAELLAQDGDVVEIQVQGNVAGGYVCAVPTGDPAPDPTDPEVVGFHLLPKSATPRAYTLTGQDIYGWSAAGTCKFVLNGTMAPLP